MKYVSILVALCLVLSGSTGVVSAVTTASEKFSGFQELHLGSAEAHLTQVEILENEVTQLDEKVKNLAERVQRYEQKPYLDTKGFHRSQLKLLIGNTQSKINSLRQQIAWHREEASRLAALHKDAEGSYADITSMGGKQNPSSFRSSSRDS